MAVKQKINNLKMENDILKQLKYNVMSYSFIIGE